MTKKIALIAASVALLFAGAAQAQTGFRAPTGTSPLYGELGYTWMKFKVEGGPNFDTGFVRGIVGYDFHPNFAVEGMLAFGVGDDTVTVTETAPGVTAVGTAKAKLSSAYGIYLKPKADVGPVELFGRLGYTRARLKGSTLVTVNGTVIDSDSGSSSDGGASYGVGANWKFTPNAYVGLDYMHYYKKDGVKAEGWTLGVGFRF